MAEMGAKWAVLIGINGYHESLGSLRYCVNDCRRLAEVLTTGEDAFPADHVLVVSDDEPAERKPTYANIHSWLASWLAQPDGDDTVLVFFAGHGREMASKCYLVPADATLQTIHVTGIPVPFVQELLERCKARQKVLLLDACHSGAGRDVLTMAAPMMETLSSGKGIYTLTSCDVDEVSHEWDEKRQGVFSHYLAEALAGECPADAEGLVTADGVYNWVCQRVMKWARDHRCRQTPRRICETSGAITLHAREPDWRRLAQDLQARLAVKDREVLDLQRDEEHSAAAATALAEVRDLVRRFAADHGGKWQRYERREFLDHIKEVYGHRAPTEAYVAQLLKEERNKLFLALPSKAKTEEGSVKGELGKPPPPPAQGAVEPTMGTVKVVISPPCADVTFLLDDELANDLVSRGKLVVGRHVLTARPKRYRYGVRRLVVHVESGKEVRRVVHLRSILHARALLSFMLILAYGLAVSAAGVLLPTTNPWSQAVAPNGMSLAPFWFVFGPWVAAGAYATPVWLIVRFVRLLKFPSPVPQPWAVCWGATVATIYIASVLTLACRADVVFSIWAVCTAIICGIVTCLVPWHPDVYATRELV